VQTTVDTNRCPAVLWTRRRLCEVAWYFVQRRAPVPGEEGVVLPAVQLGAIQRMPTTGNCRYAHSVPD